MDNFYFSTLFIQSFIHWFTKYLSVCAGHCFMSSDKVVKKVDEVFDFMEVLF